MIKHIIATLMLSYSCYGQTRPTYYNGINFNTSPTEIKAQLKTLLENTITPIPTYTPGVWEALTITDTSLNNLNKVSLIYGSDDNNTDSKYHLTRENTETQNTSTCTGKWNREHVYANSMASPKLDVSLNYTDIHNAHAADCSMNASRGNKQFTYGNGIGNNVGNNLFYPGDEWKGDVARTIMYMYLLYPTQCLATVAGDGSTSYSPDMPDLFLIWNEEDPPSEFEKNRNSKVENIQGNRNPFIDNPYIATLIWGGPQAQDTWNLLDIENINVNKDDISISLKNNYLHLFGINDSRKYDFTIYDSVGQKTQTECNSSSPILLKNIKTGQYYLKISLNNLNYTTLKFIKN